MPERRGKSRLVCVWVVGNASAQERYEMLSDHSLCLRQDVSGEEILKLGEFFWSPAISRRNLRGYEGVEQVAA